MSENFLPGCGVPVIAELFIQTPLSNTANLLNIHHIKSARQPCLFTHVQSSRRGEVEVNAHLIAELLQVVHHLALRRRVSPEEGQLWVRAEDLMSHRHVRQQHELFHQPV